MVHECASVPRTIDTMPSQAKNNDNLVIPAKVSVGERTIVTQLYPPIERFSRLVDYKVIMSIIFKRVKGWYCSQVGEVLTKCDFIVSVT